MNPLAQGQKDENGGGAGTIGSQALPLARDGVAHCFFLGKGYRHFC